MSPTDSDNTPPELRHSPGENLPPGMDSDICQAMFRHMLNGLAYCKMLFENGQPRDFIFLYTNPAFESQAGLHNVRGKRVSEVIPGLRESTPQLFDIYGRVALGGMPEKFEIYIDSLAMWFAVSVYSPRYEYFVIVFDAITERKLSEEMLRRSEERYLDIFDNTNDLIQCVAPDGSFLYTNRMWRETLGYTEQEVKSLNLRDVLHPDSMICCQERFDRLLKGETLTCINFKFLTKSGDAVHLAGDCGSIVKDGHTISTRGIFRNITDAVAMEAALKVSEARYQTLYENAPDIFITLNRAGAILSINQVGARMLGYEVGELIGESTSKVIHPEDQRAVFAHVERQFAAPGADPGIEYRMLRKDGSIFWVHQHATLDPDTQMPRLLVICRDVTERRNLEERLAHQAAHDILTNLINRREFERRLLRVLSSASEPGDEHFLCFLDLDQFKIINDTCGHIAGDDLLRQVAALLQGQMRSRDTLARIGGDEFAVLMEYSSLDGAVRLAGKILTTLQDFLFHWRSQRFSIGASIGVLPIRAGLDIAEAITLADEACYAAKKAGGNRIHVAGPGDALGPA